MAIHYLPRTDKEKAVWLKNFSLKFNGYATTLGFVAADATAIAADSAAVSYLIDLLELFKTEAKERTAYKDKLTTGAIGETLGALPTLPTLPAAPPVVPAGVFTRLSGTVMRIKGHPAYTESIGKDLGIVATTSNTLAAKAAISKPVINITKNGGVLQLKYKKGDADGLKLFSRRTGETEFTFLDTIIKPVYEDTRPNKVANQPETREYMAFYMQNDKQVGQSSDIVTVLN